MSDTPTSSLADLDGTTENPGLMADDRAVFCPSCGYDLRGSNAERCSECGMEIDRVALKTTAVPWAYRRSIGRVRAFLKTVWLVTYDSQRIRHELIRPQDDRDARRFQYANAALLTITFLIVVAAMALWSRHLQTLVVRETSAIRVLLGQSRMMSGYQQDLHIPWSAGVTVYPMVPLYLAGLALYLCGIGRGCHRRSNRSMEVLRRARVVSIYAMAPLFLLLPAALCYTAALGLDELDKKNTEKRLFDVARAIAVVLTVLVTGFSLFSAFRRSGEWITRASHAGSGRFFLGIAELLARSTIGIVMFLGVLPWCVGYWWIAIDSQF